MSKNIGKMFKSGCCVAFHQWFLCVVSLMPGHLITCGNVVYVFLFGWWVSLTYFLVSILMTITVVGVPYGR